MDAEFIVVSGALLGARFPLGDTEVRVGRAPNSDICIEGHEAAWDHCLIQPKDGHYRIYDRRTGSGTYVNGLRITEHSLEPGDHVSIGETVLIYREDSAAPPPDSREHSLLEACSLLFLFRALAASKNEATRTVLEAQLVHLIRDIVPCTAGAVLLGRDAEELRAAARRVSAPADLDPIIARVLKEGAVVEPGALVVALALYVRGVVSGVLATWFPEDEAARIHDHRDTLSAVGTIGAAALESAREVEQLHTENARLQAQLGSAESGLVGESPAMRKLIQMISRVAPQDASVLVLGESGTGKELVARALHRQSPRTDKPFMAINCAALTETLLESELFGHEKGSFTGAIAQKKGKLESAEGGSVFLDEIGELAPQLQAKLLRVLQQREFERVGGTKTLKLDVRVIAATNRDLLGDVRRGAFREDLYHRLNVVTLRIPPLRDRPADIPSLMRYFLGLASARCHRRISGFSHEAERMLTGYSWPGNVRELENTIERAVVLGDSDTIVPEDLPPEILHPTAAGASAATAAAAVSFELPAALQSSVTEVKRQRIIEAWREARGDYKAAAVLLNIHPNSLLRLIRILNLRDALR